jgi:hypothetical protein
MDGSGLEIGAVDKVARFTINTATILAACGVIVLLRLILAEKVNGKVIENTLFSLGILGGVAGLFVAYATLRNQTRQAAEIAINVEGGRIADWERSRPSVRCVYGWYDRYASASKAGKFDPEMANSCLARIVVDRENFTEVMLYAEEVFFLLQRAKSDQDIWGSDYAGKIKYWREDVGDDPTGMFSYHLVHRYPMQEAAVAGKPATSGPEKEMADAGVAIVDPCARAERVSICLEAVGRHAEPLTSPSYCVAHRRLRDDELFVRGVAKACRAEAVRLARTKRP